MPTVSSSSVKPNVQTPPISNTKISCISSSGQSATAIISSSKSLPETAVIVTMSGVSEDTIILSDDSPIATIPIKSCYNIYNNAPVISELPPSSLKQQKTVEDTTVSSKETIVSSKDPALSKKGDIVSSKDPALSSNDTVVSSKPPT